MLLISLETPINGETTLMHNIYIVNNLPVSLEHIPAPWDLALLRLFRLVGQVPQGYHICSAGPRKRHLPCS